MKKIFNTMVVVGLFSSIYAQDFNLTAGWHLLGANEDINVSKFDSLCVDYVWDYNSSSSSDPWSVHIANTGSYTIPTTIGTLKTLTQGKGFWIKANGSCDIDTSAAVSANYMAGKTFTATDDPTSNVHGYATFTLNTDGSTGIEVDYYTNGNIENSNPITWSWNSNTNTLIVNNDGASTFVFNTTPAVGVSGSFSDGEGSTSITITAFQ